MLVLGREGWFCLVVDEPQPIKFAAGLLGEEALQKRPEAPCRVGSLALDRVQ